MAILAETIPCPSRSCGSTTYRALPSFLWSKAATSCCAWCAGKLPIEFSSKIGTMTAGGSTPAADSRCKRRRPKGHEQLRLTTRWSPSASLRDASQSLRGSSTDPGQPGGGSGAILALAGQAAPPQGCSANLEAVRRQGPPRRELSYILLFSAGSLAIPQAFHLS